MPKIFRYNFDCSNLGTLTSSKSTMSTFLIYFLIVLISQMSYSLVVILELNSVLEVQYKEIMIIDDEQYQ